MLWPTAAAHQPHSQSSAQPSDTTQQEARISIAAADEATAAAPLTPIAPAFAATSQPRIKSQDLIGRMDISIGQGRSTKDLQNPPAPPSAAAAPCTSGHPAQAPAATTSPTPLTATKVDPARPLVAAAADAQADTPAEPDVAAASAVPDPSAQIDVAGPAIGVAAAADAIADAANGLPESLTATHAANAGPSPGDAMLGLPVKLVQQLLEGVEGSRYSRPK